MQRDERRPNVSTKVIYADHRHMQRKRDRFCRCDTNRKTRGKAWSMRNGHSLDDRKHTRSEFSLRAFQERSKGPEMLPRREIRDDSAVLLMQRNLAVHPLAAQTNRRIEYGQCGFVARTLERENH